MEIFFFMLVLIMSLLIGIFGFCQIVGSLKYFKPNSLITIIFWLVILSVILIVVANFLNDYLAALIIGYVISFLLSFTTKPDNYTPSSLPNSQQFNLSLLSKEDKSNYEALESIIHTIADKLIVKAPGYDYCSFERIEQSYLDSKITHDEYLEKITALKEYKSLEEMFFTYRNQQNEILKKYNMKI